MGVVMGLSMIRRFAVLVVVLSLAPWLQADPVWEVSKDGKRIRLGATVHFLRPADLPPPAAMQQAFEQAGQVYLESNLSESATPAFSRRLTQMMMQPSGRTLKDDLSAPVWRQLQDYSAQANFPLVTYQGFKPAMVSMAMTVHELGRQGFGRGVDEFYFTRANQQGKTLGFLESSDTLLSFMAQLNEENSDALIESSLEGIEHMDGMMEEAISAWRKGDMDALYSLLGADEMETEYPGIYRNLIIERNRQWYPKIQQAMTKGTPNLVLVGALHLGGPDSLRVMLEDAGYQVEPFNAGPEQGNQ
ncbi:MAG: TraB/GumN family protein [Alcanivorax sp.]|jgi:uncharacterized protein YbaP (TraB family)|uniref:TraB/GumN family protein n=2 Tax=Alcanivorax sp. TaxID=1872427 RepID=UPI0026316395|nr:TraB/GumN family protein [Alcanivorax sp.]MDF1723544.1 TraB/GumN family protein [Alcanivorax sp.]